MKNPACTALAGMVVAAVLGVAAANQEYMSGYPRPFWPYAKKAYWDKQTAYLDDQDDQDVLGQSEAQQVWQKRGFGSMMPAYLLQLYRPDQPLINPSVLFSRSSLGRGRGQG